MLRYLPLLPLLLILCVGCRTQQKPPEREYPVTLGQVVEQTVPIYIDAIGNVFSPQNVQIRPQVGGIITEEYVLDGQHVKQGDKLYQIDPRPYQAALDRAKGQLVKDKASVEFARIQVERNRNLTQQDFVSKITFEQYESQLDNAKGQVLVDEADVATAALNLEWSTITSPLDGRVSQTTIDLGNLVIIQDPNAIINIQKMDPAEIRFSIPQRDFVRVQDAANKEELKFGVILPQRPDEIRYGDIFFVDNHIDSTTGTILLKGNIENKDEFLWPGEFIRVRLQLKTVENALLVPEEAVMVGQKGTFVYIFKPESSTVEYRPVERGEKIGNLVLINKGVNLNEQIVVRGQVNLRENAKVYVTQ